MARKNWTRDELILAINLYCKTPFGRIHQHNPDIIRLAGLMGRTPSALGLKMCNFASIDPTLPRKGMGNVSKLDREIWDEFFHDWNHLAFESEELLARLENRDLAATETSPEWEPPAGVEREQAVKARVNQRFFRDMILASYDEKCCLTGLAIPGLLIASHIVPWSVDTANRLNPCNGLCLNAFHDRAFDLGYISFDEQYSLIVSPRLRHQPDTAESQFIFQYEGQQIRLPKRFLPDPKFVNHHRESIFLG